MFHATKLHHVWWALYTGSTVYLYIYKRASLACAARLADTLCPPEAPGVTLINHKGYNISKYVCPTAIINIDEKYKICQFLSFLMCNIFEIY